MPQWFSYANYEIKNYDVYEDDINDSYNLLDGQISIKDSISYVESYINNEFKYSGNKDLKTKVYSVDVVKLDENYYGYHFSIIFIFFCSIISIDYNKFIYDK